MARKAKELEAVIRISGQMDASVQKAIKKTADSINGLGAKFAKIEKAAVLAGAAITAAFTGAAVAIGKTAIDAASAFEARMSNVATLLDGDVTKRVAELGEEVRNVSRVTGASTDDLSEGLYQVISAFGDSADAIKIMDIAARAGVAGNASTIESINLLSAVTKGYGDTSAEANARAADLAFMTVKLGQTSFPELAASLGRVIPLAATMGIKQEELFGSMATLTGVTGKAAEVTTQMRGVIQGFLQPTDDMAKAIQQLGYADGKAMLESKGLAESLVALKKIVGGNEIAFSSLFGSVEAKGAVLALTGEQLDAFRSKTNAMYGDANGAAQRAFEAQTDNIKGIVKKLKAYWNVTLIEVGYAILPVIKNLLEKAMPKMQAAMDTFRDIVTRGTFALREWAKAVDWAALAQRFMATMETIKNAVAIVYSFVQGNKGTLIMLAKALGAIWAAFHAVFLTMKAFAACKAVIVSVTAVASALASTVGIVVAAIAAIGVAAWTLWEYWDEVCAFCSQAWEKVCSYLQDGWARFSAKYTSTAKFLESAWEMLCAGMKFAMRHVAFVWQTTCEVLQIAWQGFMAFIVPSWDAIKEVWNMVCTGFGNAFHIAMTAIETSINVIKGIINGWIALFQGDWDGACAHFKSAFEAVCNFWQTLWSTLVSGFHSTIESFRVIADAIKGAFSAAWDAIKDRVRAVIDSIMSYIQPLIDKVQSVIGKLSSAKEAIANSRLNPTNWFASGGFTSGPSICGEAGTEAVISFDPKYRRENQGYLMEAAQLLGMTAAPVQHNSVTYNLGGITFSPVIKAGEQAQRGNILAQLRASVPDLIDLIENALTERNSHRYA